MKNKLLLIICIMMVGCTNETGSRRALEGQGFTGITFHGPAIFRCGDDDGAATSFTANNPIYC
jgi:hypothetical protein